MNFATELYVAEMGPAPPYLNSPINRRLPSPLELNRWRLKSERKEKNYADGHKLRESCAT